MRGWTKKSLVHTVCACSVPPGFLGIWKFSVKSAPLHYNLRKVCRLLPYKRWLSLTTLRVDDDEGAKKVLSSSFAGIVHAFVHSSQTLQHVTDACRPLKFTDRFEQSNAYSYRRSDIVFDLKTARMVLRRSITMQCCLSPGTQK